ncbi:hypothetical protein N0609_30935 [Pseudomonas aeruginosa]|nr:hypothetical protein [Pseudomonas aeruginosa]MCT0604069.1 hypothetical protein [Pseudomonas aeruginosa]
MSAEKPRERPILFNDQMVRAILEGRKTVTRRAMKPQPVLDGHFWTFGGAGWSDRISNITPVAGHSLANDCPYGQPGDRLWVRESWWQAGDWQSTYPEDDTGAWFGSKRIVYSADGAPPNEPNHHYPNGLRNGTYSAAEPNKIWRHRPSIHMPRWASRILLEITAVRVERLQDITRSDIRAEGLECPPELRSDDVSPNYRDWYPEAWRELWESTGGNWDANPWVWVVEFKRVAP